jgi:hypothetical protein
MGDGRSTLPSRPTGSRTRPRSPRPPASAAGPRHPVRLRRRLREGGRRPVPPVRHRAGPEAATPPPRRGADAAVSPLRGRGRPADRGVAGPAPGGDVPPGADLHPREGRPGGTGRGSVAGRRRVTPIGLRTRPHHPRRGPPPAAPEPGRRPREHGPGEPGSGGRNGGTPRHPGCRQRRAGRGRTGDLLRGPGGAARAR